MIIWGHYMLCYSIYWGLSWDHHGIGTLNTAKMCMAMATARCAPLGIQREKQVVLRSKDGLWNLINSCFFKTVPG